MDKTELWDSVSTTPPSQTKAITGKPYRGTSPQPYWIVRRATEVFGPCGIGWGFTIISERVEDSAKQGDKLHIAHVRVWYMYNDKRGEVEHFGQTMLSGTNRNGPYTDEDAPKKSVTDALVKALSMIGFAGDIFMGRYDDSKYVSSLEQEEADALKYADARTREEEDAAAEAKATTDLRNCETIQQLQKAWLATPKHIRPLVEHVKDEMKAQFEKRKRPNGIRQ